MKRSQKRGLTPSPSNWAQSSSNPVRKRVRFDEEHSADISLFAILHFPRSLVFFLFQVIRTRHEKRRERENSVHHTMREGRFYHFMRARRGLDDLVQVVFHVCCEGQSVREKEVGDGYRSKFTCSILRFWRIYLSFEGGKAITLKCLVRKPTKGLKWKRTKCVQ